MESSCAHAKVHSVPYGACTFFFPLCMNFDCLTTNFFALAPFGKCVSKKYGTFEEGAYKKTQIADTTEAAPRIAIPRKER